MEVFISMSSYLEKLKSCTSISDLISEFELNITPQQFSYIVYKVEDSKKYQTFTILKKSGDDRIIQKPHNSLKEIQKSIANILMHCVDDIRKDKPNYLKCSHAFEWGKSIVSNSEIHINKKFVLNIDIADFFDSIHYGRIKGFFVSDYYFSLNETIARVIAKVATCNGTLPQGSPLSPIISSLIGNLIDIKFLELAKKYRFTYSRYADDITLSSNKELSDELVIWDRENNVWKVTNTIESLLNRKSGFKINEKKTRYNRFSSRQLVTGIVVNKEKNVVREYKKQNRSMVNSLLNTGEFFIKDISDEHIKGTIEQLIGRLNYCIYVKYYKPNNLTKLDLDSKIDNKEDNRKNIRKMVSLRIDKNDENFPLQKPDHQMYLLRSVLFFKYFTNITQTTIYPEGYTDPMYFSIATEKLNKKGLFYFQKINDSLKKLGLSGGASSVNYFISKFVEHSYFIRFSSIVPTHPAIFVLDYDNGLDGCQYILNSKRFGFIKKKNIQFSHIKDNVYVLLLSPISNEKSWKKKENYKCIENFITYQGKIIQVSDEEGEYVSFKDDKIKKYNFAQYIMNKPDEFSFSEFSNLFDQISLIESDYKERLAMK
ncbi:RNA-directed DNA polymerase [Lonepinella koalarum]|nr:RNA-directed DNA polymerase [Lonepinella koalarum]